MRKLDQNGLIVCDYQGKLFEKSSELDCSSPIFLRRFMHSELVDILDWNESYFLPLPVQEGINSITNEFGNSSYGKIKYSKSSLYWMGYMYRYISYTRDESTWFIMKTFPYRQLNDVYYSFHTQDPEWCIKNLLDINGLDENEFDKNYRLKRAMLKSEEYRK